MEAEAADAPSQKKRPRNGFTAELPGPKEGVTGGGLDTYLVRSPECHTVRSHFTGLSTIPNKVWSSEFFYHFMSVASNESLSSCDI